jgi:phosphoesterase RecJ-like protein
MIKRIIETGELSKLKAAVAAVSRIVITCHKKADGDAIGSSLALCLMLRKMGKNATVIIPDQLPGSLTFITEGIDYVTFSRSEVTAGNIIRNTQLIMSLDYNNFERVDRMKPRLEEAKVPKILIDHHLNPADIFDVTISHPEVSSTSELIYRIAYEAGWLEYIDKQVASCIFVGMMTDTGNLAWSSSYPEVYHIMGKLMEYGIDKAYLYKMAMDTVPLNSLLLQSYAILHKMTVIDDKFALVVLDKDDLEKYNYKTGDTERLVNKPLSVKEIYWSTFMREDPDCIKVSMRSEGDLAVDLLCARYFNGGGHKHAAAGEFNGTMTEAIAIYNKIVEEVKNIEITKN